MRVEVAIGAPVPAPTGVDEDGFSGDLDALEGSRADAPVGTSARVDPDYRTWATLSSGSWARSAPWR